MSIKIKARDIIPGWPRSRSTTTSWQNRRWMFANDWFTQRFLNNETIADLSSDALYHYSQTVMMDRHRSEYRRPTPAWMARKMMASGTGIVIATCGDTPGTINLGERERPWKFGGRKSPSSDERILGDYDIKKTLLYTNTIVDYRS